MLLFFIFSSSFCCQIALTLIQGLPSNSKHFELSGQTVKLHHYVWEEGLIRVQQPSLCMGSRTAVTAESSDLGQGKQEKKKSVAMTCRALVFEEPECKSYWLSYRFFQEENRIKKKNRHTGWISGPIICSFPFLLCSPTRSTRRQGGDCSTLGE